MIQYRCGKRIDVSKCPRWVRLGGNPSSHPISMGPWDLYRIGVPSFPGTSVGKPKSPGFPSNHLILSVVGGAKKDLVHITSYIVIRAAALSSDIEDR